jgi:heme exporter protein D
MNWGSLDAFLAMGGYGFYVWGSYAVTAALLALEVVLLRRRHRTLRRAVSPSAHHRES